MWIMTPIICFSWKKKTWFLASCRGGSEEVLNCILLWKYASCHLSLDVSVFHLSWKLRLICNLFLRKRKAYVRCFDILCIFLLRKLQNFLQTITEKCKLNCTHYPLAVGWCLNVLGFSCPTWTIALGNSMTWKLMWLKFCWWVFTQTRWPFSSLSPWWTHSEGTLACWVEPMSILVQFPKNNNFPQPLMIFLKH